jgi:cell division topological specificity factor
MSLFNLFRRRGTAPIARERLQILLSYERTARGQSDLLGILREEILAALGKHITVDQDNIVMRMDRGATLSTLEIEILIPHSGGVLVPVVTH